MNILSGMQYMEECFEQTNGDHVTEYYVIDSDDYSTEQLAFKIYKNVKKQKIQKCSTRRYLRDISVISYVNICLYAIDFVENLTTCFLIICKHNTVIIPYTILIKRMFKECEDNRRLLQYCIIHIYVDCDFSALFRSFSSIYGKRNEIHGLSFFLCMRDVKFGS